MNDRNHKRHVSEIDALVQKWKHLLWLDQWDVKHRHYRCGFNPDDEGKFAQAMRTHVRWPYRMIRIECSCSEVVEHSPAQQERTIVHELLHGIVNEMREWEDHDGRIAIDHEERVVTHLEWVLWGLRPKDKKRAKRARKP